MALERVEDRPSPRRISRTPCDEEEVPPRALMGRKEEVLVLLEEEEEEEGVGREQVAAAAGGSDGGLLLMAALVVVRKRPSSTAAPRRPCLLLCRSMAVGVIGCRREEGALVKLLLLEAKGADQGDEEKLGLDVRLLHSCRL